MPLALVVTHVLKPGHEDAFDALVLRTLGGIRVHEPGTLVYVSHTDPEHPRRRIFYELYTDRAAFEAHERQPHVRTFLDTRPQHLESVEATFLEGLMGTASPVRLPAEDGAGDLGGQSTAGAGETAPEAR